MVNNSELTGPLCKYEDEIFAIMERKGYKFDHVVSKIHPVTYVFYKEKQIGDNRFWNFIMTIRVNTRWYPYDDKCFSAEYELQLKEYSKNEKGYIDAYWGRTPWAVAKSCYWMSDAPDYTNLIKSIRIYHPY